MADLANLVKTTSITAGTDTAHVLHAACRAFCLFAGAATTAASWRPSLTGSTAISFFKLGWTGWIKDDTNLLGRTIYVSSAAGPVEVQEIIN